MKGSFLTVFLFTIITLLFNTVNSQISTLNIYYPSEAGKTVKVIGYDYLVSDTIGTSKLDTTGKCSLQLKYSGFALILIADQKQYPVILKNKTHSISITEETPYPWFGNDPDNNFLYRTLIAKEQLMRKKMTLDESLNFFGNGDPFNPFLAGEKEKLQLSETELKKSTKDSSFYISSILMQARDIMETTYNIKTEAELKDRKNAFLNFIDNNIKVLRHSDMIQQLASQYAMMNEYVITGQNNHYNQVAKDVGDWNKRLGKYMGKSSITTYFMNQYAGRSMFGMAGRIADNHNKYARCKTSLKYKGIKADKKNCITEAGIKNSKAGDNAVKLKNIPSAYKVLVFHDNDCPACYVQDVMIGRYVRDKMLQIHIITVFREGQAANAVIKLSRLKNEPFYYSAGVSSKFNQEIGITGMCHALDRFYFYNRQAPFSKDAIVRKFHQP